MTRGSRRRAGLARGHHRRGRRQAPAEIGEPLRENLRPSDSVFADYTLVAIVGTRTVNVIASDGPSNSTVTMTSA
jgi:hypothetical protein